MISELRTFIAVARHGTFSLTADRVGLSQAAVSGQMKRLEEMVGVTLFDRTGRSAVLNADGVRMLRRVEEVVALFDALRDPDPVSTSGKLRVGAIASMQTWVLARALVPFGARYPLVQVHVVPGVSLHMLDQVDSGELDLAILIQPPFELPPDLLWQPLASDPYVLAVPVACEGEDWRQLLQTQPFLRYDRLSFAGRQVDRFIRRLPFKVTEAMQIPMQGMLEMVASGFGVAMIPRSPSSKPLPPGVRLVELKGETLSREMGIVRSHTSTMAPTVDFLTECLSDVVQAPAPQP